MIIFGMKFVFFLGKLKSTSYFSLQIGLRLSEFAQAFFPFFFLKVSDYLSLLRFSLFLFLLL